MLTIGEILKKEREEKGISLSAIEKKIKIREKYLKALEENDWDYFSSKIYITGIIKNYSKFLGLDTQKMLAFFRRDYERKEEVKFNKKVSSRYLTPQTRMLTLTAIGLVFLFFFLYFGFQLFLFFKPPRVEIISPKSDSFKNIERIKVVGETQKEAVVTIFGERVFLDREGKFEYDFPLKKGKNTLTIEVIGANGKKQTVSREFTRTK